METMETPHEFFLNTPGNPFFFLIDLLNFHMLFRQYPWKFHVYDPVKKSLEVRCSFGLWLPLQTLIKELVKYFSKASLKYTAKISMDIIYTKMFYIVQDLFF